MMEARRIKALFSAQLKEFSRDYGSMFLSLVFPLFFVVILIAANLVQTATRLDFALVDPNRHPAGLALADALGSENVQIVSIDGSAAQQALADGKVKAVVSLPAEPEGEIELLADPPYASFAQLVFDAARAAAA